MAVDLEKIMILMQRRYTCIKEIERLTRELERELQRNDQVSVSLMLQMRADEMAKADRCKEELWDMTNIGPEYVPVIKHLFEDKPPALSEDSSFEEKKISEIRGNMLKILAQIREADKRMNQRVAGDRSYYK